MRHLAKLVVVEPFTNVKAGAPVRNREQVLILLLNQGVGGCMNMH